MATKQTQSVPDWQRLQRKIFTRWVNQKLIKRNISVEDIVNDISTGIVLVALMEVLSEKTFTGKMDKNPKLKANKIDNLTMALKFVWECGVEMKIKPAAEQLYDGDQTAILGLIWGIMNKYMKIGDEDDGQQLSAKDALLLWAQNKTAGYKDVKIEKFGKDWHDGLALCAIIHKHRPKLIPWDTLSKENKLENLRLAQNAAEIYFGLEKYITAEEITKLDENSLVVYVSEYYYGIAQARKLDLAAKRISKVIKLTVENDSMRSDYNKTAQQFKERLTGAEKVLEDRTIDDTMSGAKQRIEKFYEYKTKDKNVLLGQQLDLEALYNNLAMRLSHHKRPEFLPPKGLTLKDVSQAVVHLEECEQERKVALHAELNRQIRLAHLAEEHGSRHTQLTAWAEEKNAYLKTREEVSSVSAAELQLRLLEAYEKEYSHVSETSLQQLNGLSKELLSERYEHSSEITSHDSTLKAQFQTLEELSKLKRPVLEDHLEREKFKEHVRQLNQEHINNFQKLQSWIAEKEAYLNERPNVTSVSEARTQLSLFDSYTKERQNEIDTSVPELYNLGKEVLSARYSSAHSSWSIESPEHLRAREDTVRNAFEQSLVASAAEKKAVLEDHLSREEFAERVRMLNRNHMDRFERLNNWCGEKRTYLQTKETVETVGEARTQLLRLDAYDREQRRMTELQVAACKRLGEEIRAQRYESPHSSYVFENPQEVLQREQKIDRMWTELGGLSKAKRDTLNGDLARELEKERLRMEFARVATEFTRWSRDSCQSLAVAHFGFTLEEVEAYESVLEKSNATLNESLQRKSTHFQDLYQAMIKAQVRDNIYTRLTLEDLAHCRSDVENALQKRTNEFRQELARQRANDALCKQFASLADPFVKRILDTKIAITESKAELEEQLRFVQASIADLPSIGTGLAPINDVFAQMEAAGIVNNRYTTLTAKDVAVQWEQYQAFLTKKERMLAEEIEHHKLRGVTPEQFSEIEANFKQFDINRNGIIDKKELKACLYSLGEEKSRAEIDQIMVKYGDKTKNGISYSGFREFMIDLLGVSVTKDDILGSFALITGSDEIATLEKMDIVMEESDVDYVKKTAPPKANGYDYPVWTTDVFSR